MLDDEGSPERREGPSEVELCLERISSRVYEGEKQRVTKVKKMVSKKRKPLSSMKLTGKKKKRTAACGGSAKEHGVRGAETMDRK